MPTVFIVDDDSAALRSLNSLLTCHGYSVKAFASAEEFLASDDKVQPGCLLCDVRLSGMTGLELHQKLKAESIELPIILISGYADADLVERASETGVQLVLEKPIDPQLLIDHVESLLRKAQ